MRRLRSGVSPIVALDKNNFYKSDVSPELLVQPMVVSRGIPLQLDW